MKDKFKKDFPIFKNLPKLVYLDSAATSQRPKIVVDALKNFYEKENANIHRGIYTLSEDATKNYELVRKKIANFINSNADEIIFTKNATEGFNLLANTIKELISKDKNEIVLTDMEHHSNLLPWQNFAKKYKFKLKFIPLTKNYELDYDKAKELINKKTAMISFTFVSNVLGTINDAQKLISLANTQKAMTIIDASQAIQHFKINVKKLNCDFLVFSSHKMMGPTGVGVLYGKKKLLEKMPPFLVGGGTIDSVDYENAVYLNHPRKFEAGTQNFADVIALGNSIDYLKQIGFDKIQKHESELFEYALEKLHKIKDIKIYNPGKNKSAPVISFNLQDIHPHDIAHILNDYNIAIRAGHHCCMPLIKKLGILGTCKVSGVCRASLSIYNTKEDINKLITALKKTQEIFGK
ncbi:MAG TPA: SufS family cysteine desulfurase [Candidatus Nanoarchaeia archaeon]|nr:SufS family cysteine desulfurase [Candidatus Nanoarchaeia archaeon]